MPFTARMRRALRDHAAEKAGLPDAWRPHDLRHRRCTPWLAQRRSPDLVRDALAELES